MITPSDEAAQRMVAAALNGLFGEAHMNGAPIEWLLVTLPKGRAVTAVDVLSSTDMPAARAIEALEVAVEQVHHDNPSR